MWIFTPLGYFSVVQANADELMIRSRCKADLERLVLVLGEPHVEIVSTLKPHCDYPFRLFVQRERFGDYMKAFTENITYTNFKDEVASVDADRSHGPYLKIWSVLRSALDPRAVARR